MDRSQCRARPRGKRMEWLLTVLTHWKLVYEPQYIVIAIDALDDLGIDMIRHVLRLRPTQLMGPWFFTSIHPFPGQLSFQPMMMASKCVAAFPWCEFLMAPSSMYLGARVRHQRGRPLEVQRVTLDSSDTMRIIGGVSPPPHWSKKLVPLDSMYGFHCN